MLLSPFLASSRSSPSLSRSSFPLPPPRRVSTNCASSSSVRNASPLRWRRSSTGVARSELRPLVECDASCPRMPHTSGLAIMALQRINATLATQSTRHETDVFERTIGSLSRSLDKLARGGELMITAFEWIFQIPPRFIDLLRARHPFSLAIVAPYAVIIHLLRRHWWVGDWGERMIQAVGRHLDAEWRKSISWVLDATGCYIPGCT